MSEEFSISYPDWSSPSGDYLFPDHDLVELGVRLGYGSRLSRSGRVVFQDPLTSLAGWNSTIVLPCYVGITNQLTLDRDSCVVMYVKNPATGVLFKNIPPIIGQRTGLELSFFPVSNPGFREFHLLQYLTDGNCISLILSLVNGTISYQTSGGWVLSSVSYQADIWNTVKVTADFKTYDYLHLSCNDTDEDLTGQMVHAPYPGPISTSNFEQINITMTADGGAELTDRYQNLIITASEY